MRKVARREFLKETTVLAAAALVSPAATISAAPRAASTSKSENYQSSWYPFTGHPDADTCWSLSVGPDGRIYAAACAESVPGGVVKLVRYNEHTDSLDYLLSLDEVVEDPGDSGRATQCKIHYSFAPSMADGVLYMATHLSGPPIDQPIYSPWYSWHDPQRSFRGSALVAFDTKTDRVLWWDTMIPKEGCRCLLHDEERHLLYALSYPRDHFIIYDTKKRTRRDLGRIGSINAQTLFLDRHHRVWTTDDYGHLVRYDPQTDRLERSPFVLPYNPQFQTGWHSVFYDVAATPDGESVFAVNWIAQPRLMRIWPNEGDWPRVEDLGAVTQERDPTFPTDTFKDHCGGLTFAGDGQLYYVASRWRDAVYNPTPADRPEREGVVWRLDPRTLQREEVAVLQHPTQLAQYVSRGAVDHRGHLFFGGIGQRPPGIFQLHLPADRRKPNAHLPIRVWG
ncbi:MAG: hypothetical protein V9H26_13975 [Verrucomicrobiota bacterium]